MNTHVEVGGALPIGARRDATATQATLFSKASTAFGWSAAVTVIFNTLLAWVKDAYDPLNTWMAHLTGHHWITHGLFDIALFVVLGFVLMNAGAGARTTPNGLVVRLIGAVVVAGLGLAAWFVVT
jgi:hypothetical protein